MNRELNDAEYAAMLAGGNVSVAWHSIPRDQFRFETIDSAMKLAVYNAVRQVFGDRLSITLPTEMPDLWADDSEQSPADSFEVRT